MTPQQIKTQENVNKAHSLIAENGDFIKNIILQQTNDPHLTDDIFQDLFISLINNPLKEKIPNIKNYLRKAAKNDVIDAFRKNKTVLKNRHKYYDYNKRKKNFSETPLNELIEKEQKDKLYTAAKKHLTPSQFEVLKLRFHKGCDVSKTAQKMNINKRSVSRYLSVSIKKLSEELQPQRAELYECA